jgi:hypothetical protein
MFASLSSTNNDAGISRVTNQLFTGHHTRIFFLHDKFYEGDGTMKKLFCFIIIFLFWGINTAAIGAESTKNMAMGEAYFDVATGHRYIKNSNTTYAEYSKRGKLLRTDVPNTQPHLAKSNYITELTHESYLVYEKYLNEGVVQQVLLASDKHPEGWRCEAILPLSAEAYENPGIEE